MIRGAAERGRPSVAISAQYRSVGNSIRVHHHVHGDYVGLIGCHPVIPRGQREPERMAAEFGLFVDDVTASVDDDFYWMSGLTRWSRAFSGRACNHTKVRSGRFGRGGRGSASGESEGPGRGSLFQRH